MEERYLGAHCTPYAAYAAGVSAMLPKPFTVEQLDIVLQGFV